MSLGFVESRWLLSNPLTLSNLAKKWGFKSVVRVPTFERLESGYNISQLDRQTDFYASEGIEGLVGQGFFFKSGVSFCQAKVLSGEHDGYLIETLNLLSRLGVRIANVGAPESRLMNCQDACGSRGITAFTTHMALIAKSFGMTVDLENLPVGAVGLATGQPLVSAARSAGGIFRITLDLGNLASWHTTKWSFKREARYFWESGLVGTLQWNLGATLHDDWLLSVVSESDMLSEGQNLFIEGIHDDQDAERAIEISKRLNSQD